MNDDRAILRQAVLAVLRRTAPEIAGTEIDSARPLRDQVDIDSIDWLNFLVGLHDRFAIDIPESDYAKLVTLDDLLAYLTLRAARSA
jgi:acyl carrier protein